jgi:hypothetical protein
LTVPFAGVDHRTDDLDLPAAAGVRALLPPGRPHDEIAGSVGAQDDRAEDVDGAPLRLADRDLTARLLRLRDGEGLQQSLAGGRVAPEDADARLSRPLENAQLVGPR